MTIKVCSNCGGLHYGSLKCPYLCERCGKDIRPDETPRCECPPIEQPGPKPDRPDGDGLLPAPGTILQIGGAAPGQGWGMNVIEVRESTGGVGWRWRSITAIENQWLIDALNAKVTPPTRDGAEGACPNCGSTAPDHSFGCFRAPPKPAPGHTDLMVTPESIDAFMEKNPLPAPDAMREARAIIRSLLRYADGHELRGNAISELNSLNNRANIFLSAPVPPADGPPIQDTYLIDSRLPIRAISGDAEDDRAVKLHFRHKVTDQDRVRLTAVLNAGEQALASPAVAAEPVAWQKRPMFGDIRVWSHVEAGSYLDVHEFWISQNYEIRPVYVSPPVRGDREAVAQTNLIRDSIQRVYDEMCVKFSGVHSDDQTDSWLLNLHHSLKLLSLLIQSKE